MPCWCPCSTLTWLEYLVITQNRGSLNLAKTMVVTKLLEGEEQASLRLLLLEEGVKNPLSLSS